jgi:hypothetical protein
MCEKEVNTIGGLSTLMSTFEAIMYGEFHGVSRRA